MSLFRAAKKGLASIASIEIFRYFCETFILIFTARLLTPDDFGIVASALVVIGISDSLTHFGFNIPIIQFKKDSISYLNTAWTADIIRAIIIFLIIFSFSGSLSLYMQIEELKIVLILLSIRPILQSLVNPYLNYQIRNLDYKKYIIIFLTGTIIRLLIIIPLTIIYKNYWALVIGSLIATFSKTLVSYIVIDYKPKFELAYSKIKKLFNFSIWIIFSRIYNIFYKNAPYLIVFNFGNLTGVGGYRLSEQIGSAFDNIYKKFNSKVFLPVFSEINRSNDTEKNKYYQLNISLLFAITVCFIFPCVYFSETIINLFLGRKWLFIDNMLKFFFIIGGISVFNNLITSLNISIGKPNIDTIIKLFILPFFLITLFFIKDIDSLLFLIFTTIALNTIFNLAFFLNFVKLSLVRIVIIITRLIFPIIPSFIMIEYLNFNHFFEISVYTLLFLFISIIQFYIFNSKSIIHEIIDILKQKRK